MKTRITEYLQSLLEDEQEKYLQDNCSTIEEMAPFGDTEVSVGTNYSQSDYDTAREYAMNLVEEAAIEALKQVKKDNGFDSEVTEKRFLKAIEKAKEVLSGL